MISTKSSQTINSLKCILCISVVFIHSQITPMGGGNNLVFFKIQHFLADTFLDHTCVPLFFCISGYLFFLKLPQKEYVQYFLNKIYSRVRSLLIPYLLANFFTILLLWFLSYFLDRNFIPDGYKSVYSIFVGHSVHNLPIDMPLWYIRNLLEITIISPIIYIAVTKAPVPYFLLLTILWLFFDYTFFYSLSASHILYFSLGSLLAVKGKDFVLFFRPEKWGFLYLLIYIIVLLLVEFTNSSLLLKISILISFPAWVYFAYTITANNVNIEDFFVTGSFFVFLYHYYIPGYIYRIFFYIIPQNNLSLMLLFIAVPIITTTLLLLVYKILHKYLPKFTSLLVGGR